MARKTLCLALVFTLLPLALTSQDRAQEDKKRQEQSLKHEVTVTANRVETSSREVASSITVITREDIRRLQKRSVLELLENVAGLVTLQNGPPGSSASVFIRGANSEHTLVMMDGVELNDPMSPSRSFDLAHLTLGNIERIEILRGPQSTLYGSDALAGVINIITKRGEGKPQGLFRTQGGSFGSFSGGLEYGGSTDRFHFSLGTSYSRTSGFSAASPPQVENSEKDGYRNLMVYSRLGFLPRNNLELDLTFRTLRTRIDLDNFSGAYRDDPNNVQDFDSLFIKAEVRLKMMDNRWEQRILLAVNDSLRQNDNAVDPLHPGETEQARYKSRLYKLDWQNNLFLHEKNTLTWGLDFQKEQGESEYTSESSFGSLSSPFPQKLARTTGVYAQDRVRIGRSLHATLGGRLDHHSQFGTSLTFRAAPALLFPSSGTKLKATYGTGFKSPSLYQLFAPPSAFGSIGNSELSPEESAGWDVGVEQDLWERSVRVGATYFSTLLKNLIDFDFLSGYINIAEAKTHGLELSFLSRLSPNLSLSGNYTRTEAFDRSTGDLLLRRPRDTFKLALTYSFKNALALDLWLTHIGSREDMDYSTWPSQRVQLSAFTLVNAVINTDLVPGVNTFLRLDNIFDVEYEWVLGYATPGFSIYVGFDLDF